jgi:DNA-binding NarL/FixJ family response regulator
MCPESIRDMRGPRADRGSTRPDPPPDRLLFTLADMVSTPRLLVCDDAPGFRLLVQTVFGDGGFDVVGTAATWDEAHRAALELSPDAILLDLWLPVFEREGVSAVRAAAPEAVLAVVSSLATSQVAELVAGLDGIDLMLSKRESPEEMVRALRALLP